MIEFSGRVAARLNIRQQQANAVLALLAEGATIPFIARYRKDKTGNLDEVQIQNVQEQAKAMHELSERKIFIEKTIAGGGNMTAEVQAKLDEATTLAELEDIYLPYKPKRKTRAQTARENGLAPLSELLLQQTNINVAEEAAKYISENVKTTEEVLKGARDIIAENINENGEVRAGLRKLFEDAALFESKVIADKETEGIKYKDYYSFAEPVHKIPSHRILAVLRGFLEGFLRLSIAPPEEDAFYLIEKKYITNYLNSSVEQVKKAIAEAYRRLLQPSLETEFRTALKNKADEDAIHVFAENLRQLLLSAPLGNKKLIAIDPGYRTGCKLVCLNEQGELIDSDVIFPHENNRRDEAKSKIENRVKKYGTEAFAIGDGTAGRETEQFIKSLALGVPVFMVNEDGASVYSASETAREEFPTEDVTVRGAVSIGRRLIDPLAELVKIDPKSIGVGQYQHDVNQSRLKERLDQTVVSCVNAVGVNLNTASKHLLAYVSGIGAATAENIIRYRNETGGFTNRNQLLKVPRLGNKAFEQCAGFLRISQGDNPLDGSAVHPEAYAVVQKMATDLSIHVAHLIGNETLLKTIEPKQYVTETIGALTIADVLNELKKPGLDPRSEIRAFEFAPVYKIEDVVAGMVVPGIVTNITRFGAFIDIGVKQDALVHISEMAHRFISDPNEAVKLGKAVQVKVLEVDVARKRIAVSIKAAEVTPDKSGKKNEPSRAKAMIAKKPSLPAPAADSHNLNMNDALSLLKKKFGK